MNRQRLKTLRNRPWLGGRIPSNILIQFRHTNIYMHIHGLHLRIGAEITITLLRHAGYFFLPKYPFEYVVHMFQMII